MLRDGHLSTEMDFSGASQFMKLKNRALDEKTLRMPSNAGCCYVVLAHICESIQNR